MTSQAMTTDDIREQRKKTVTDPSTQVGLNTTGSFELTMRIAHMLSQSTMVPEQFRAVAADKTANKVNGEYPLVANPNGLPNCVIAINMANRMGADPLMIMQNLYVVEGRPSWSSQFIVAAINSCGRYSPLRFDLIDKGDIEVTYQTKKWDNNKGRSGGYEFTDHKIKIRNLVCVAWATEKETGQRLESSPISMELAVKEGWYQKNGSKWQTMPEQMLRYRAASFFGRIYAPELLMGIRSADEVQDMIDVTPAEEAIKPEAKTVEEVREMVTGQPEVTETTQPEQPKTRRKAAPQPEPETQTDPTPETARSYMPRKSVEAIIAEFKKTTDSDVLSDLWRTRVSDHLENISEADQAELDMEYSAQLDALNA